MNPDTPPPDAVADLIAVALSAEPTSLTGTENVLTPRRTLTAIREYLRSVVVDFVANAEKVVKLDAENEALRADRDRLAAEVERHEQNAEAAAVAKHGLSGLCCALRHNEKNRADKLADELAAIRAAGEAAVAGETT